MKQQPGKVSKESDGYKVVFKRIFNHPIEKVWDAITNPEQLKYWFTDVEFDFKPGGQIIIKFRDEAKTVSRGKIVSIDAPNKFVWTWEDELAVWELEKLSANQTQLIFSYSKLPKDYAVNAPAGFHSLLDRLEERLNGSDVIYPFGTEENDPEQIKMKVAYAAHVYHAHPEAVKHEPVVVERLYNAPVEKVWKALTDKEQMKEWYFNLDQFELREGFQFRFPGQGYKGEQYMHICTITEIIPRERLQYSWQYENLQGYSLVTFHLTAIGNQTKLRLTHHGLETFPQDNADFARSSFNEGWNHIVGISLPEYLSKHSGTEYRAS